MSFSPGDIVRLRTENPLDGVVGVVERSGHLQTRVNFLRLPWTPTEVSLSEMRDFPHEQLTKCPDPWGAAAAGDWSDLELLRLRVRAAELWMGNTGGRLGNARTDLLPHQVCLVHEVLQRSPRRLMIAEEVGMGKTIETGMIVHALMERRELERCLVICPAGQVRQWQEELEEKLRIRFEIYRQDVDGQRAFTFPRVIASLDTVKLESPTQRLRGKSHRDILLDAPDWDLIVFDEAHRLSARDYGVKTEKTLNYRLAEELCGRTRDFLFLTGTPHDGNDSKFRNLLKALDPEVSFSPEGPGRFFGTIILKNRKSTAIDAEGKHLFREVIVKKVALSPAQDGEANFHEQLNEYLREGYGVAEQDPANPRNRAIGFVMTTFQKLASSSVAAVRHALRKRLATLEGRAPDDGEVPASASDDERFEGEVTEDKLAAVLATELRDAFATKEIGMLRDLVEFPVPTEAKWKELERLVHEVSGEDAAEKFLIFTEYRGTVSFLKSRLEARYGEGSVVTIMGGMGPDARADTIATFREEGRCRFLVSTEAGGEGINLQFCHLVVNYDLPWNPFRLVQRIGRIHRIGQRRNMQVFNLRLRNALDDRLSHCHEDRVDQAVERLSNVTGLDIEDIREQLLGFAQEFINYDQLYREAVLRGETGQPEAEIRRGIEEAEKAFQLAYETVFRHAVSPFNPDRFKSLIGDGFSLDDLRVWLEAYLKANGRRLMWREEAKQWEFLIPDALKDRLSSERRAIKGTFDREIAMRNGAVQLLAFGHPEIELILRSALAPDSAGTAASVRSPNLPAGTVIAWLILREQPHAGSSAYRMLVVKRDPEGFCSFCDDIMRESWSSAAGEPLESVEMIRSELVGFLEHELNEIDFIEDRILWLAVVVSD